jgi:uncharacterized membrane protein (UPF0127 family)
MANFLLPLIHYASRSYQLRNARNGALIAHTVIPAFEPAARRKGLLGRDSFAAGSAMVIAPTNAIHTFWMRFPIDVVFVRRNGTVVKVRRSVPPWRAVAALRAYAVIELPARTRAIADLKVGDVLTMAPVAASVEPQLARVG